MIEDVFHHYLSCESSPCVAWHVSLAMGALVLGLWFGYEIWCRPWRAGDVEIFRGVEPQGWGGAARRASGEGGEDRHSSPAREIAAPAEELSLPVDELPAPADEGSAKVERDGAGFMRPGEEPEGTRSGRKESGGLPVALREGATEMAERGGASPGESAGYESRETLLVAAMKAINRSIERETGSHGAKAETARGLTGAGEPGENELKPVEDQMEVGWEALEVPDGTEEVEAGEYQETLGFVYMAAPRQIDDLTLIEGINPRIEAHLQQHGVFRFAQIAGWTAPQAGEFGRRLSMGRAIFEEDWMGQARRLAETQEGLRAERFVAPALVDQEQIREEMGDSELLECDAELGLRFRELPEVRDRLVSIDGIDDRLEQQMAELGICRFRQIGSWTNRNVEGVAAVLGIPKDRIEREKWIPQARHMQEICYRGSRIWARARPALREYEARIAEVYAGENVRVDPELGIVYRSAPARIDPLPRIEGISEVMADWLQACGVFRFQQIGDWSRHNAEAFAERLDLPAERILSERWIAQARKFTLR